MAPVLMLAAQLHVTGSITGGYHPLVRFVASSPSGRQARPAQTEGDTGQRPVSQMIPGE
jgi:hypothetical protein